MDTLTRARTFVLHLALPLLLTLVFASNCRADYRLTVLHTNDVHARIEQFDKYVGECNAEEDAAGECFGGVARRVTKVNEIRAAEDNVVLVDGGDQYQGTMWFFLYKGAATSHFMNMVGYDAMAIGNHEFDNEPEGLAPFLANVTFPVLSCNIDASLEPSIDGNFEKSVILDVNGERIGVIGYTYFKTNEISSTGDVLFFPEVENIQREVDAFTQAGINKIIAVGHSGINIDLDIAKRVRGVDVVVGGHTDTFMYTGTPPSTEVPYGVYPQVVNQDGGGRALVVQDYTFGKYLGRLDVTFNDAGEVIDHGGNPILLDQSTEEDPFVKAEVEEWAEYVRNSSSLKVGVTHAFLEGERSMCRARECNLGNLICDAMVSQNNKNPDELRWNDVGMAIMNGGSIRSSIAKGDILIGSVGNVLPFSNTVDIIELKGVYLWEVFENSVSVYDTSILDGRFVQVSGIRVVYNLAREVGRRVVSLDVLCTNCTVPQYEPVDLDTIYTIIMPSFLANGGDGFQVIKDNKMNQVTGNLDSAVLVEYIQRLSPVAPPLEGRVVLLNETEPADPCIGAASQTVASNSILVVVISALILAIHSTIDL